MASSGLQTLLEVQVQSSLSQAKHLSGDGGLDWRRWQGTTACGEQNACEANALSLSMHVSKRTIQKYMRAMRTTRPPGQTWRTFIHTHAQQSWACDFLPVTDLFFCSLFAFFIWCGAEVSHPR